MLKTQIIITLLFFFNIKFFAQEVDLKRKKSKYVVSGYIKEDKSKETLLEVSVYVKSLGIGAVTNNYGFYSIEVPEGNYEFIFSFLGYSTITKNIEVKSDIVVNEFLEEISESLGEVEITAQKVIKESKLNQMSAVSISQKDIENTPVLLGEKDALKTLQLLPGIQGGSEGAAGIFVRGGSPDQNLIILDEATVYNSNHLFGFFSVFNGDAIKSLTAFKGGFPSRFGGRLSSVIKIDTKDGNKEKLSGKVNIGLISSSMVLEGPIQKGKTSFIFSGRRTYADLLAKPFQSSDMKTEYFFHDLNFKIHHIINQKNKLFWSSYLGQDNFIDSYEGDISKIKWGSVTSTLRWNHEFSNKLFANTSLIYSNYKFKSSFDFKNFDSAVNTQLKTDTGINDYSIKTDFDYYLASNHHARFGAIATMHNFVPQQTKGIVSEEAFSTKKEINSIEGALYIEDDWKVSKALSILPGVRYSYFKQDKIVYDAFEPRLSVVVRPKDNLALKMSYSKMNQYVHLLTSGGFSLPTDLWVTSTDKIKPQISEQIAVGIAKDFDNTGYSLTIEGYYKKMKQVISYKGGVSFLGETVSEGKDVSFEDNLTFGEGLAYGTEVLFRKQKGKFTGWLGYTISWSDRQFDELNGGKRFFARYDRRHDISIVTNYKPSKKVSLSATWVLSSGSNFTLPEQQIVGVQSNFPIQSSTFFANDDPIQNITTERNGVRGETSHRLDIGIQLHKKLRKNRERTWAFSVYNIYGRKNPFAYTFEGNGFSTANSKLYRTSAFSIVPSVSYSLKF